MKKIFISNLCGVGDLIRMEPLIRGVRKKFPDAYIFLLTREGREDIFFKNPEVNEVLTFPISKCNERIKAGHDFIQVLQEEFFVFYHYLRQIDFDIAIVPPHFGDSVINGFIRAKEYFGMYSEKWGEDEVRGEGAKRFHSLFADAGEKKNDENLTELFLDVVQELQLDLTPDEKIPKINTSLNEEIFQKEFLKGISRFFVFNLGSRVPQKRWNSQKAALLADKCIETFNVSIIFGGTEEEYQNLIQNAIVNMRHQDHARNAAGKTSLLEYAALIEKADLLVSTDSAPMHLGDACRTPLVALFSEEGSKISESKPSQGSAALIVKPTMSEVGVEEVFLEIKQTINVSS